MRIKIILVLLFIFIFSQNALSSESTEKFTRVSIKASDSVKYESRWLDNPPRLMLKFKTDNVFGHLVKYTALNEGAIKNIAVTYYPLEGSSSNRRQIKFLTFWLKEKTPYKVWSADKNIVIDFKNPISSEASKEIEISSTVKVNDFASKTLAADKLLASFGTSQHAQPAVSTRRTSLTDSDLKWLFAMLLVAIYIMWYRPLEWKNLIARLTGPHTQPYANIEKRKWWRHNLLPLKDQNIYIKVESPDSNTKLGLVPRNIGYGGLSFKCNRLKKLKGKLNLSIFLPGFARPVEVNGNIAWQRNSWNLFRRHVGISFINPPNRDWARIHRYIEEQYAALKS